VEYTEGVASAPVVSGNRIASISTIARMKLSNSFSPKK